MLSTPVRERYAGVVSGKGDLGLRIIRPRDREPIIKTFSLREVFFQGFPIKGLPEEVKRWRERNLYFLIRGIPRLLFAQHFGIPHYYGSLYLTLLREGAIPLDLGLAGLKVITTAGVNFLVDAWQNSVELETMKYHGIGTGSGAEATGDTALGTELTTEYNPDNTRATGSLTEGGGANVFRSVGTNTVDAAVNLREHGLLSQAATGGGTLWDRTVFSSINLANGDSLQSTHDTTVSAGG